MKHLSDILIMAVLTIILIGTFASEPSEIHTDQETGCQYIVNIQGGITPRLDADGTHKGCKK